MTDLSMIVWRVILGLIVLFMLSPLLILFIYSFSDKTLPD